MSLSLEQLWKHRTQYGLLLEPVLERGKNDVFCSLGIYLDEVKILDLVLFDELGKRGAIHLYERTSEQCKHAMSRMLAELADAPASSWGGFLDPRIPCCRHRRHPWGKCQVCP